MAATAASATTSSMSRLQFVQHHAKRLWKPYLGTSVAVSVSMIVGDYICQQLEAEQRLRKTHTKEQLQQDGSQLNAVANRMLFSHELDYNRTRAMGISGFFVSAPLGHTVQRVLEYYIPGRNNTSIAKKMLVNSASAPLFIALSFTSITLLKGGTTSDASSKVQRDLASTWLTGACYWPIVSFFNFKYVTLNYRAAVGSFFGCIWNVYLSRQANSMDAEHTAVAASSATLEAPAAQALLATNKPSPSTVTS